MSLITIAAKKGLRCGGGANGTADRGDSFTLSRPIPLFYMSDYSVLGVLVDNIEEAGRALADRGYRPTGIKGGIEMETRGGENLRDIVGFLEAHGISCEIADLVDQMYQG